MLKKYLIFVVIVAASLWGLRRALHDGSFIRFVDQHPHPTYTPPVLYYTAVTYGLFQNLEQASTYYIRVPEQFPTSSYADDSYFEYLQALDERMVLTRAELAAQYETYLAKYPGGKHSAVVTNRISSLRTGA